jgi:hypothetical protein
MKPYQHIKNQKQIINEMTFELQHLKDKDKGVKRINTLIDTINAFESMLEGKYYTDTIETLLYARIYSQLMGKVLDKKIDIHEIVRNIENDITYGKEVKKAEVVHILEHKELMNKIETDNFYNFANWNKMLSELINEFKLSVKWTN